MSEITIINIFSKTKFLKRFPESLCIDNRGCYVEYKELIKGFCKTCLFIASVLELFNQILYVKLRKILKFLYIIVYILVNIKYHS